MVSPDRECGRGDVHDKIVDYLGMYISSGGRIFSVPTRVSEWKWQTSQLYQLFFALRNRVLPDMGSQVYTCNYHEVDASLTRTVLLCNLVQIKLLKLDVVSTTPTKAISANVIY